jgi:Arc/MetJ-type ribon-helix-helix transcriptional regulator
MYRTQILLDPEQHAALTAIAGREQRSLSDLVREMLRLQLEERRQRSLATAAQALLADYRDDPELAAFTALDAEDVHAQG